MNVGNMIDRIQALMDDDSSETETDILLHLNTAYLSIAASHIWTKLTKQVTLTSTVLPADLQRVIYVEDDTDQLYFKGGIPTRYFSEKLYNWFFNMPASDPLLTVNDGVCTANSTAVSSATGGFTSAMAGEYITIGENLGVYEISSVTDTNNIVLSKGFRGASGTAQHLEVRPTGTLALLRHDEAGEEDSSTTAKMWYLAKPLPLYNAYDPIELPGDCEALRIKTFRLLLEGDKYDNDSLKQVPEFEAALAQMKSMDPVPERFTVPRDRLGSRIMFGRRRRTSPASIHSTRAYW